MYWMHDWISYKFLPLQYFWKVWAVISSFCFTNRKHKSTDTCIAFLCRLGKNNLNFSVWTCSNNELTQQCPLKYSGQWCLPQSITIHDVFFSCICYANIYTSQFQLLNECIILTPKHGFHLSHLKRTFLNQKETRFSLESINLSALQEPNITLTSPENTHFMHDSNRDICSILSFFFF